MKRPLSPPAIATLAVAALCLLSLAASWAGSSQIACVSCHDGFAKAQAATEHRSTACTACHAAGAVSRIAVGASVVGRMLPAQLLGRGLSGPVNQTGREACLACHSAIQRGVSSGSDGLRIRHSVCARGASCDDCHSTVPHGTVIRWKREPVMQDCIACHTARGASTRCTTCHVGKSAEQRLAAGPWQVTHGPEWQRTHGMGKLDSCSTCHAKDYCVRCHKVVVPHDVSFGSEHGKSAIADRASCLTCHKTAAFCDACHGLPMPHPSDFLKSHSSVAKTVDNPVCQRCHSRQTCDACHVAHVHPGFAAVGRNRTTSSGGAPR